MQSLVDLLDRVSGVWFVKVQTFQPTLKHITIMFKSIMVKMIVYSVMASTFYILNTTSSKLVHTNTALQALET